MINTEYNNTLKSVLEGAVAEMKPILDKPRVKTSFNTEDIIDKVFRRYGAFRMARSLKNSSFKNTKYLRKNRQ